MESNTDGLSWYLTHNNNGHGQFSAKASRLLSLGYLKCTPRSRYAWVLSITEEGKKALNAEQPAAV